MNLRSFLAISLLGLLTGCVFAPTTSRTISLTGKVPTGDVLENAIEVAKLVNFPPMTKLDKANGIVEFGGFGMSELGITAQVRVRPDNQAEITVKRGSAYIPLGADKQADAFRNQLESRLKEVEQRAGGK